MALVLLNPGIEPLGQFTGLSTLISSVKGGEVLTFGAASTVQGGAADDADGYLATGYRPIVTNVLTTAATLPVMLCDDGLLHYGTLFGSVVGGTVGQQVNGPNSYTGAVLGPATALGSGKLTAWDKPGLYGVTLDACDSTPGTGAGAGLQPANASLTPGVPLYGAIANLTTTLLAGQLTPTSTSNSRAVGSFVEFRTNGSLVTTPNRLVSALNSPSTVVGGVLPAQLFMAVFHFSA
jgi:hypothetical protein